jgi:hypothetical protein
MTKNEEKKIDFLSLIQSSDEFQRLKDELKLSIKLSLTGITNFVVNHEDPFLVNSFLQSTFKLEELYNNTIEIDAVELQLGQPGKFNAYSYIDQLIYGSIDTEEDQDLGISIPSIDPQTGKRIRKLDGFVNREEVLRDKFKDKILVIKNIDFCMDFCSSEKPGHIDAKVIDIFENFRNINIRRKCKLLLISNVKLILPFKVKTIEIKPVDTCSANHIIDSLSDLCKKTNRDFTLTHSQKDQITRKLSGLTYTEASEILLTSIIFSQDESKIIDVPYAIKKLRSYINQKFLDDGFGLTQLISRPWDDYICPESSNFTWDIKKMLRDFEEIKLIKNKIKQAIENEEDESKYENIVESIQSRIPHVIALYGQGGTGKSAFPIHLAGLLGFDVWDFNINSLHSKWVGQGSEQARKSITSIMNSSHIIVRIDEYDRAMGSTNGSAEGMHEAHKQVESEFMSWLQNGHEDNSFIDKNIFIIMTTNHKDNITGPMLRSGRIDLVIDIDNFDLNSIKKAFQTTARRIKNRNLKVLGFDSEKELQDSINSLDLDKISEICSEKGFTVRDIETLIIEMAAYHYYYLNGHKDSLQWNTNNFINVLKNSEGSMKEDGSTGEFILGDRQVISELGDKKNEEQFEFIFQNKENKDIGFEILAL